MPRVKSKAVIRPGLDKLLEYEPEIKEQLLAGAEVIAMSSKALAHAEAYDTGDYERGIETYVGSEGVRVIATDFKSHWIEWGTSTGFAARHVLRRAAQMIGFRVEGGRR